MFLLGTYSNFENQDDISFDYSSLSALMFVTNTTQFTVCSLVMNLGEELQKVCYTHNVKLVLEN